MTTCHAELDARPVDPEVADLTDWLEPQAGAPNQAVRLQLICRIRALIESGRYDTDTRLQAALDRLLDDMM